MNTNVYILRFVIQFVNMFIFVYAFYQFICRRQTSKCLSFVSLDLISADQAGWDEMINRA